MIRVKLPFAHGDLLCLTHHCGRGPVDLLLVRMRLYGSKRAGWGHIHAPWFSSTLPANLRGGTLSLRAAARFRMVLLRPCLGKLAGQLVDTRELMTKTKTSPNLTWTDMPYPLRRREATVNSEARPSGSRSDQCLIPDLRSIPLEQLARQAADGEIDVVSVVSRIVDGRKCPSSVSAMMFNSAI